jgi:hypothetical protein
MLAVLLTGCASGSRPPSAGTEAPDVSTVGAPVLPPPDIGDAPGGGGGKGRPAAAGGWSKPGVTGEQKRADIEACYSFATAQIANDVRIDKDIDAARDQVNSYQYRFDNLTRQVDGHYYSKQRITRFGNCMLSKGYIRG